MATWAWTARIAAWVRWVAEPRLFWLALVVTVVAAGFSIRPGATELQVRFVAAILQLFGVAQVAWGIRDTRKLFGVPGITEWTRDWWDRRPGNNRIRVMAGQASLGSMAARLRAEVQRVTEPDTPLEERVANLERNLRYANERIGRVEADLDRVADEHSAQLKAEAQRLTEQIGTLRELVTTTQTGGLALSSAGALLLAVGIILGTFPEKIAGWLGQCAVL